MDHSPTKTELIQSWLRARVQDDLSVLYTPSMEAQVNVAQDLGQPVELEFKGRDYRAFTDGEETWSSFRIPRNAWKNPEYEDHSIQWNFGKHVEAIGLTGWDWKEQVSRWVTVDFDSIINHKAGLEEEQLKDIKSEVSAIPWITMRKSTSGKGIHLYIHFERPVPTLTHTEHAALGKAVLLLIGTYCSFPIESHADCCGAVAWVWHRNQVKDAYTIIKKAEAPLGKIPDWRQFLTNKSRETRRIDQLRVSVRPKTIGPEHKKLFRWLEENATYSWWWDSDRSMMVAHTLDLVMASDELKFRGEFTTNSSGSSNQNCFAFPLQGGAWVVRRYGQGVRETLDWETDRGGWTRAFLNRHLPVEVLVRRFGGEALSDKEFKFPEAQQLIDLVCGYWKTAKQPILDDIDKRYGVLKRGTRNQGWMARISSRKGDQRLRDDHWEAVNNGLFIQWKFNLEEEATALNPVEVGDEEETLRHVNLNRQAQGWFLRGEDGKWVNHPGQNIRRVLVSRGLDYSAADAEMGDHLLDSWTLQSIPFAPEYPGHRIWNRDGARLAVTEKQGSWPTWMKIFLDLGKGLDEAVRVNPWCKHHAVSRGSDWLQLWVASLLQRPKVHLPYLAFVGEQKSGKSTFHSALALLFEERRGYTIANSALTSAQGFNGELNGSVVCVIEEINVNTPYALPRVRDWVTSDYMSIHAKGGTPYLVDNYTHWIQCTNRLENVPLNEKDTRVVIIPTNPQEQPIAKEELMDSLRDEAPALLHSMSAIQLPGVDDRLGVSHLRSDQSYQAEIAIEEPTMIFIREMTWPATGKLTKWKDFRQAYHAWFSDNYPDDLRSAKVKTLSNRIPMEYPIGAYGGSNDYHIGNIVLKSDYPEPPEQTSTLVIRAENQRLTVQKLA